MTQIIEAVAGVLISGNKVLMGSRPQGKPYAGSWEFPGGKLEKNEDNISALIRELDEEIGIQVSADSCKILTCIVQSYTEDITVKLYVVLVSTWNGEIVALENQELYWHDLNTKCIKEPLLITTQKILNLITDNLNNK